MQNESLRLHRREVRPYRVHCMECVEFLTKTRFLADRGCSAREDVVKMTREGLCVVCRTLKPVRSRHGRCAWVEYGEASYLADDLPFLIATRAGRAELLEDRRCKVNSKGDKVSNADITRGNGQKSSKEKYYLQLFVTGQTPRSVKSVDNLKRLCEKYLKGRYELEVIDIYQQPALASENQIIAAPTLIKRLPLPLRRLVGDFSNQDDVLFGLDLRLA